MHAEADTPRVVVVEDDDSLRRLLRVTLEASEMEVDDAASAIAARWKIATERPDVVVLDIGLPGLDGLELCRELRGREETAGIGIVVITGSTGSDVAARAAGADAFLRKPFDPLELARLVQSLAALRPRDDRAEDGGPAPGEQLLLYARDLSVLLGLERHPHGLLARAYRETVSALASALEWKDAGTGAHCHRVRRYALELAAAIHPDLLEDPSVEFGFLLHDIGKIAVPDRVLQKPSALSPAERREMEQHPVVGERLLADVALLQGQGIGVVRSHHERWDGRGYPDALAGDDIPVGARVFAVADALDAMTSDRPYRPARSWEEAVGELVRDSGGHFDPKIVAALRAREPVLRRIHYEVTTT